MEITWRVINRGLGRGERGGKVQRINSINDKWKIDRGKNSIGNVEAKELTCITHGHKL